MKCEICQPVFTPTPHLQHHGKETCAACGRFIRWVPKPQTIERQNRNGSAVVALRNNENLTAWERAFIATLDGQGPKVSPKQQGVLDKLVAKYGN